MIVIVLSMFKTMVVSAFYSGVIKYCCEHVSVEKEMTGLLQIHQRREQVWNCFQLPTFRENNDDWIQFSGVV